MRTAKKLAPGSMLGIRLGGARSSMRTFRPAAPGSTSQTQPTRNPCPGA